jgi:hypothetical protein
MLLLCFFGKIQTAGIVNVESAGFCRPYSSNSTNQNAALFKSPVDHGLHGKCGSSFDARSDWILSFPAFLSSGTFTIPFCRVGHARSIINIRLLQFRYKPETIVADLMMMLTLERRNYCLLR